MISIKKYIVIIVLVFFILSLVFNFYLYLNHLDLSEKVIRLERESTYCGKELDLCQDKVEKLESDIEEFERKIKILLYMGIYRGIIMDDPDFDYFENE